MSTSRDAEHVHDLEGIAKSMLDMHPKLRIFTFTGPLGAGKTALVKALCQQLGIDPSSVQSPTFGLVHPYLAANGEEVFHFDLYRVKSEEELIEFGFESYLDSGAYCFIEWPSLALPFLPNDYLSVSLSVNGTVRKIEWKHEL